MRYANKSMATQDFRLVTMKLYSTLQQQQGIKPCKNQNQAIIGARSKANEHWIRLPMAWEYRAMLCLWYYMVCGPQGKSYYSPPKDRSGIHKLATQNIVWRESHWFHGHRKCWNLGSCETASHNVLDDYAKIVIWIQPYWMSGRKRKRFSECLVCGKSLNWNLCSVRHQRGTGEKPYFSVYSSQGHSPSGTTNHATLFSLEVYPFSPKLVRI